MRSTGVVVIQRRRLLNITFLQAPFFSWLLQVYYVDDYYIINDDYSS